MAQHNKNRDKRNSQSNGSGKAANQTPAVEKIPLKTRIVEAADEAMSAAINSPDSSVLSTIVEPMPSESTLQDLWTKVSEARQLYTNLSARLKNEIEAAEKKNATLRADLEEVNAREQDLKDRKKQADEVIARVAGEQKNLEEKQKEFQKRDRELIQRELEARNGFWATYEEILQQAREHVGELQTRMADSVERLTKGELEAASRQSFRITELEKAFQETKIKYWEGTNAKFAERSAELDIREQAVRERERGLRQERAELEIRLEIFSEDQTRFESRVSQQVDARVENLRGELGTVRTALVAARERRDQLEQILEKRKEAERRFGNQSPEELLEERDALRVGISALEQKLASRLSESSMQELAAFRDRCALLESEKQSLSVERSRLYTQLENSRIAVSEMEIQKRHKEVLESQKKLLEAKIEDLKEDIEQYTRQGSGKSSFPACCEMDENARLQEKPSVRLSTVSNLKTFASVIQQVIAQQGLFYSEHDIRSFLGGLAMSRLHILQGISGTGKTSLPIAFAKSICAGYSVIGVQAGWREHQDLIGHYNVFEQRFHETDFLKALYKAQTPSLSDRLYMVVLDEMNLSRPEQYCSELLMALEQREGERRLTVHANRPAGAPNYLLEDGKITLPPNVWFIGTANHDETTVEFADKTYDRAHVMELPSRYPKTEIGPERPPSPVSYEKLMEAFAQAQGESELVSDARRAMDYLNKHLSSLLNSRFRVGWGNRLERQLLSYVPVVMSAGGTLAEATDHLLATKILRKIRDRYDLKRGDMVELQKRLDKTWSILDPKNPPFESLSIIENEINRRGTEQDDSCVLTETE
jgi:hypothetical protein